jgi:glycosyltransferase involved in cell wall biosynthesis
MLSKLNETCEVHFDIFGPSDDPDYLGKCMQAIRALPPHIKANYRGPVENSAVREILGGTHFMFLLTFNENFGHAISESLSAGRPVIISDRTPWRGLEKQQCGWDLDLFDEPAILKALNHACYMNQEEYNRWSQASAEYANSVIRNEEHLNRTLALFS